MNDLDLHFAQPGWPDSVVMATARQKKSLKSPITKSAPHPGDQMLPFETPNADKNNIGLDISWSF